MRRPRAPRPTYIRLNEGILPEAQYRVGKLLVRNATEGYVELAGAQRITLSGNDFAEITAEEYGAELNRVNEAQDQAARDLAERIKAGKLQRARAMSAHDRSIEIGRIKNAITGLQYRSFRYDNAADERRLREELSYLEAAENEGLTPAPAALFSEPVSDRLMEKL